MPRARAAATARRACSAGTSPSSRISYESRPVPSAVNSAHGSTSRSAGAQPAADSSVTTLSATDAPSATSSEPTGSRQSAVPDADR